MLVCNHRKVRLLLLVIVWICLQISPFFFFLRNEKTFSFFKDACEKQNGLIIENVTKTYPRKKLFEYGFDDLINLYEIRK